MAAGSIEPAFRPPARLFRCAWKALATCLKAGVSYSDAVPESVVAVQTFGDFQDFNPHLLIISKYDHVPFYL